MRVPVVHVGRLDLLDVRLGLGRFDGDHVGLHVAQAATESVVGVERHLCEQSGELDRELGRAELVHQVGTQRQVVALRGVLGVLLTLSFLAALRALLLELVRRQVGCRRGLAARLTVLHELVAGLLECRQLCLAACRHPCGVGRVHESLVASLDHDCALVRHRGVGVVGREAERDLRVAPLRRAPLVLVRFGQRQGLHAGAQGLGHVLGRQHLVEGLHRVFAQQVDVHAHVGSVSLQRPEHSGEVGLERVRAHLVGCHELGELVSDRGAHLRDRSQRGCGGQRNVAGGDALLGSLRQLEQAQPLAHERCGLVEQLGQLRLVGAGRLGQRGEGSRLLDRRHVGALDVLGDRQAQALVAGGAHDHHGHLLEAGSLGSSHAALAGDQFVAVTLLGDEDRLQHAVALDARRQAFVFALVEGRAGVVPVDDLHVVDVDDLWCCGVAHSVVLSDRVCHPISAPIAGW